DRAREAGTQDRTRQRSPRRRRGLLATLRLTRGAGVPFASLRQARCICRSFRWSVCVRETTRRAASTSMKIVVADSISESALQALKSQPAWQIVCLPGGSLEDVIRDADALVVRSATRVTAELLERAPRLRAIGRAGVGVDNVDLDAATKRGIVVMNTPGGNAVSVAEHTLALILALAR